MGWQEYSQHLLLDKVPKCHHKTCVCVLISLYPLCWHANFIFLYCCRAFAAPAVLLTTVGQGVFRGIKNMRAPLMITLGTNVLHLGLDVVLMFRLGLGIQGAAISTAASEWLSAGAYGWLIWQRRELLGLWPPPRAHWHELKARCAPFLQVGCVSMRGAGLACLVGSRLLGGGDVCKFLLQVP